MKRRPKFDHFDLLAVKDRWAVLWDAGKPADQPVGSVGMWVDAVLDTLYARKKVDIILPELLAAEASLSDRGLAQEYIDNLITVTRASEDNIMALVTANSSSRARAVEMTLAYEEECKRKSEVEQ